MPVQGKYDQKKMKQNAHYHKIFYKFSKSRKKHSTTEVPPWNGQFSNTGDGGIKPVLRDPIKQVYLSFWW